MLMRGWGGLKGGVLAAMVVLALGARGLAGQGVGRVPDLATPVSGVAWPVVNLNVVVLGKDGAPRKVDEPGFQVLEGGKERSVQVVGLAGSPVSVALVVDLSGSVFERKDAVKAAVKALVKQLPEGSEVTVVDFSEAAYLDLPFTDPAKADFSFLDRLGVQGKSAVYDAVFATEAYMVSHAKYPRRALVVVSDGEDNASHASIGNVIARMEQPGAPVVYACVPAKANFFQQERMAGQIHMQALAKYGGGTLFHLNPDPEAVAGRIAEAIQSQYVLQFTAGEPARDGRFRQLEVRLPEKDVQVFGLPGYFAPAK